MLVYSVGSKQSFEMMRIIRDKILNHLVRAHALPLIPGAANMDVGHGMGTHCHRRQQVRLPPRAATSDKGGRASPS